MRFLKSLFFSFSVLATQIVVAKAAFADDFTIITKQPNGDYQWNRINPQTEVDTDLGILGSNGNNAVPANWLGSTTPEIGVISTNEAGQIIWKIKDSLGATSEISFGNGGDTIISGADFNNNGTSDMAAARQVRSRVVWDISLDPFLGTPTNSQVTFGNDINRIFFINPDGVSDQIAAMIRDRRGRVSIRVKDLASGAVRTLSRFPASVHKLSRPFPVKTESGADIIGFSAKHSNSIYLEFYQLSGKRIGRITLPGSGDVIIGDFNDGPGEEVAVKSTGSEYFAVFNPTSKAVAAVHAKIGIPVDNVNVIKTSGRVSTTPNPTQPPVGGEISCTSVIDVKNLRNVLYKNENLHGGRGRTFLDQDHQLGGVRKLLVAGLNGTVFACFGLYACDQPYGCRYYQQMCNDTLSNSAFINAATTNGGGSPPYALVSAGSGKCFKIRADIERYGSVRK